MHMLYDTAVSTKCIYTGHICKGHLHIIHNTCSSSSSITLLSSGQKQQRLVQKQHRLQQEAGKTLGQQEEKEPCDS